MLENFIPNGSDFSSREKSSEWDPSICWVELSSGFRELWTLYRELKRMTDGSCIVR